MHTQLYNTSQHNMDNDRLLQTTLAKMYNYFTHTKKQILVTMLNTVEDNYQRY